MKEIIINSSKLVDRQLTSRISVQGSIRKYFSSLNLFVKYDADITASRSILNIPLLATVLPLAWLTGSDIYVDELDKTFKESMDKLQQEFMKMYPDPPFTTNINADVLVKNQMGKIDTLRRTGLLFSGGVDSIYSLITNINRKPRLIMIWGVEGQPYPQYPEYWRRVISTYSEFARKMGVRFHLVKTDALEVLDSKRIEHDFHESLLDGTFWARLQHSLVLLPLTAPLSIDRFDRLLIAATNDPTHPYSKHPWGSRPSTDEKIVWAGLQVKHDGYIPRPEKITGPIGDFLKNDELPLRVCLKRRREHEELNCSQCEKCFRTIAPLVLAGLDPNKCGFQVDDSTFQSMKNMFENGKLDNESIEAYWKPIKRIIPKKIDYNPFRSKDFFEWFSHFDLRSKEKNVWIYRDIYNKLPYSLSKVLDILYKMIGINIHDHSPIRLAEKNLQISDEKRMIYK
jgi:hypothetical protein